LFLKDPVTEGRVRFRQTSTVHYSWENVWKEFKFEDSGEDAEYLCWKISRESCIKLQTSIEEDLQDPPKFRMAGQDRFFGNNGHNCYTWAKEKLAIINISLETSIWDKLVASEPIKHIQSQKSCLII
jgi:hypothetical protein